MIHIGTVELLIRLRLVGKMFGITSTLLYEQIHVPGGEKIGPSTWKFHMPFPSSILHKI